MQKAYYELHSLEVNVERCTLVRGVESDRSLAAVHDVLGDSQPESHAGGLGGEVRHKDLILNVLRDTRAVVGDRDLYIVES